LAGAVAGERWRRGRGSTVAAARSPVKGQAWLSNVRRTELLGVQGKVLGGSTGLESRRKGELGNGYPAAAAGARALTSRKVSQDNTRACKLKRCEKKG
jgi:hypothetical protein